MEEIWKPVSGWEQFYEVSNLGRIKRLPRRVKLRENVYYEIPLEYLKCNKNSHGYKGAHLRDAYSKRKYSMVHRLVAQAFILNPDNKNIVNHKNGIRDDNRVENLEWVTQSENVKHSYREGLKVSNKGIDHPRALLDETQVKTIKAIGFELSSGQLANYFKVSKQAIKDIRKNKSWKHLWTN